MRALLVAIAVAASACGSAAAPPAMPAGPPSLARVCVLRPERIAAATTIEIRDNARLVGATRGGTYSCYLAAPGQHQITSVDDDTGPTLLIARPGARYWLHQEVTLFAGALHAHLDFVDEPTATEMLEHVDTRVLVAVSGHDGQGDAMPVAAAKP